MNENQQILFEGTYPTTPEILLGTLNDFWLSRASSLEGTLIGRIQFIPGPSSKHLSKTYIQLGSSNLQIIGEFDVRRLNEGLIKITIPSTGGNVTFYRGEGWVEISRMTDKFLSDFGCHLKELYKEAKPEFLTQGEAKALDFDTLNKARSYVDKKLHKSKP